MTVELSAQQEQAIFAARDWYNTVRGSSMASEAPYFALAGFAGSGKSTILPDLISSFRLNFEDVAFMAPTGKAAKVMRTKFKEAGTTATCKTIHSSIYLPKMLPADVLEKRLEDTKNQRSHYIQHSGAPDDERDQEYAKTIAILEADLNKAIDGNDGPSFQLNTESNVRKARLIVCDEASMVGTRIAHDLRFFGIPILAIGDPGQLPPIGDTPGFMGDELKPDFFLTEIHRQAKDNPIIRLSKMARDKQTIPYGNYGPGIDVLPKSRDDATYNIEREAMVIVGTNNKRWRTTKRLRKVMGFEGNSPQKGEPLIVVRNSRKAVELVNGSFLQCLENTPALEDGQPYCTINADDEDGLKYHLKTVQGIWEEHQAFQRDAHSCHKMEAFRARKEGEHVDWGWVITCHKSQGSQWDDVIVHDEGAVFGEQSHKWRYTAITRAAKTLTIIS